MVGVSSLSASLAYLLTYTYSLLSALVFWVGDLRGLTMPSNNGRREQAFFRPHPSVVVLPKSWPKSGGPAKCAPPDHLKKTTPDECCDMPLLQGDLNQLRLSSQRRRGLEMMPIGARAIQEWGTPDIARGSRRPQPFIQLVVISRKRTTCDMPVDLRPKTCAKTSRETGWRSDGWLA